MRNDKWSSSTESEEASDFLYPLFLVYNFQENLIRTMLQLEQTFFDLASTSKTDTIVICDRGAMDPSSCKSTELLPYNFFKFQISFLGKGIETLKEEEERVLGYVQ